MIGYVYLKTLELMFKGELIMYHENNWVLPSYTEATIVADSLYKMGCFKEDLRFYYPEYNRVQYFKLSTEGLHQLKLGRDWWNSLSIIQKVKVRLLLY